MIPMIELMPQELVYFIDMIVNQAALAAEFQSEMNVQRPVLSFVPGIARIPNSERTASSTPTMGFQSKS
jgi:hypothetical protein